MSEARKYEFSESLLRGDEDLGDIDLNVEDILNEPDDYETPTLRPNRLQAAGPGPRAFARVESAGGLKEAAEPKIKNESGLSVRNWNNEDQKTPFGDSKAVGSFSGEGTRVARSCCSARSPTSTRSTNRATSRSSACCARSTTTRWPRPRRT